MWQESTPTTTTEDVVQEANPIWQALAYCPITLRMSKLLNLVPRVRQAMETRLQTPQVTIQANFAESTAGSAIIDH